MSPQIGRVKTVHNVSKFGVTLEMLLVIQDNASLFYNMMPDSPAFRCLPPTRFSDDPGAHAQGFGSPMALVEKICKERRAC